MPLHAIEDVLTFRSQIADEMTVERVEGPAGDWELREGQLVNRAVDFFRIVGRATDTGPQLLFRQTEPALVGLVVSGPPGARRVLLNARAEPGLEGGCQISSTVQSTPANYERRHGGGGTPFLDTVLHAGRVLHDSTQFDWGSYYHLKTKRIRIVEIDGEPAVEEPLFWADQSLLSTLLLADHLVTADLRTAVAALSARDAGIVAPAASDPVPSVAPEGDDRDVPLDDLEQWNGDRRIVWMRTRAPSREVTEWVQPLMAVREPVDIALAIRRTPDGRLEAATTHATQAGLDGRRLLHPATVPGEHVRSVAVSAEGGRFDRHSATVRIVRAAADAEVDAETEWMDLGALLAAAATSMTTSLETRLALGLLLASPDVR